MIIQIVCVELGGCIYSGVRGALGENAEDGGCTEEYGESPLNHA